MKLRVGAWLVWLYRLSLSLLAISYVDSAQTVKNPANSIKGGNLEIHSEEMECDVQSSKAIAVGKVVISYKKDSTLLKMNCHRAEALLTSRGDISEVSTFAADSRAKNKGNDAPQILDTEVVIERFSITPSGHSTKNAEIKAQKCHYVVKNQEAICTGNVKINYKGQHLEGEECQINFAAGTYKMKSGKKPIHMDFKVSKDKNNKLP